MPKLAVVILNFNTKDFLASFIPGVLEQLIPGSELIVVDNASTDGSADWVSKEYPELRLIRLERNFGYAGGYNRAIKEIQSDYILLLNSDVEVSSNWIEPLMDRIQQDSQIAAVQPKILSQQKPELFEYAGAAGGLLDKWGYPFCLGRIFDEVELDHGQYDKARPIFWASGAAILLRRELFTKAAGFDEEFFAHMEEIDLCWRLQHMGYEIWSEPRSVVYHVGGGTLANGSAFKYYLNYRNNLAMLTKNLHTPFWFVLIFWKMILDGLSAINFAFAGRWFVLKQVLRAHGHYWKRLGYWIKRRRDQERLPIDKQLYQKSVVWQYFGLRKRKFSEL